MIELLLKQILKKYRGDWGFLGVGQKTTIARLWKIKLEDFRFRVGLFIERDA